MIVICSLISVIYCSPPIEKRDPKWFFPRQTLTNVVLKRRLITEMIPSSCAVIDATLQPCRNVRRMDINPTPPRRIQSTEAPAAAPSMQMLSPPMPNNQAPIEPSSDGGSWFWGGITTVIQEIVSVETLKVPDPNTVITFSVKGCKPTRLPFNLPICSTNNDFNVSNVSSAFPLRTADLHYIQD
ncbi:hypothetical protein O3M35_001662 [Rhynocoris fuscipes]|uniref:Uncharacterized protein n=1 Tax=Rhynocoris fuscipes TaxID=488301 RepID=A0AAW1CVT7_9HEMI